MSEVIGGLVSDSWLVSGDVGRTWQTGMSYICLAWCGEGRSRWLICWTCFSIREHLLYYLRLAWHVYNDCIKPTGLTINHLIDQLIFLRWVLSWNYTLTMRHAAALYDKRVRLKRNDKIKLNNYNYLYYYKNEMVSVCHLITHKLLDRLHWRFAQI